MKEEYIYKFKELNEEMQHCSKIVNEYSAKNTEIILEVILITLGVLAGGLIVGAIFDAVGKAVVISILANILAVHDKLGRVSENHGMIKRNELRIAEIKTTLKEMTDKEYENVKKVSTTKEKEETSTKKNSTKYTYNSSKSKTAPKNKEIPIEFFDNDDFEDIPTQKKR